MNEQNDDQETKEQEPPENLTLYRLALYEGALRRIGSVDWPVNITGNSPQKIAREVLS